MSIVRDILVRITADNSGLNKGLDAAKAGLKKFSVAAAAALGAAAASFVALIPVAAKAAKEIDNFARVANTNTTVFQKWAAAAQTVGIEQEKLADILKDVNDRVGDFLTTGGGPMADFFENIAPKVGVTADQFARLSGPEALQLYVDSLEKAGVNQQQMTFYMEAMAGDLTNLVPLLRNGGAEMKRLGDAAEAAGRIHTPEMIKAGVELDRVLGDMAATMKQSATAAVLEHKDEILALANWISTVVIPALGELIGFIGGVAQSFSDAIPAVNEWAKSVARALGLESEWSNRGTEANEGNEYEKDWEGRQNEAGREGGDPSNSGAWPLDENGNVIMDDGGPNLETNIPPPPAYAPPQGKPKGGSGGGGGSSLEDELADRLETLQRGLQTETEWLSEWYDEGLKTLDDALAAKKLTEEEYRAEREKLEKEHADRMRYIDEEAMNAKLENARVILGGLSALMGTESKKLFKIGQAAALAQAMIDGWAAATAAWKWGMATGGPPLAAAFTAASLAKTAAMISSIRSASPTGSGSSSGGTGGTATGGSASALPTQRIDVAWNGPAESMGGMQALLDTLNDAAARGLRIDARLVAP